MNLDLFIQAHLPSPTWWNGKKLNILWRPWLSNLIKSNEYSDFMGSKAIFHFSQIRSTVKKMFLNQPTLFTQISIQLNPSLNDHWANWEINCMVFLFNGKKNPKVRAFLTGAQKAPMTIWNGYCYSCFGQLLNMNKILLLYIMVILCHNFTLFLHQNIYSRFSIASHYLMQFLNY